MKSSSSNVLLKLHTFRICASAAHILRSYIEDFHLFGGDAVCDAAAAASDFPLARGCPASTEEARRHFLPNHIRRPWNIRRWRARRQR